MQKRLLVHIIVIVLAAGAGGYLARMLHSEQAKFSVAKTAFSTGLAGFNKFASDIQWMLFVNYSGSIKSVDEENAPIVFNKLLSIVNNDPGFEKAYEIGALMLSVAAPANALEILDKGVNNPQLNTNWKIPFYAGYVATHHLPDKDKDANLDRAEKYFKIAVDRSGGNEKHVISQLIHTKAKKLKDKKFSDKVSGKNIPITSDKQARLVALYKEWKNMEKNRMNENFGGDINSMPVNFEELILSTMQSAKKSDPENKNLIESIEIVKRDVFKSKHLCEGCLSSFGPGDKFCGACGMAVEIYGICPKCSSTLKGKYCSNCGTDSCSK